MVRKFTWQRVEDKRDEVGLLMTGHRSGRLQPSQSQELARTNPKPGIQQTGHRDPDFEPTSTAYCVKQARVRTGS